MGDNFWKDDGTVISDDELARLRLLLAKRGMAIVPITATAAMLAATDDDDDPIWAGGVEHYFRNDEEAFWYGRMVWKTMIDAACDWKP